MSKRFGIKDDEESKQVDCATYLPTNERYVANLINYDSRVITDLKIPHITTLES